MEGIGLLIAGNPRSWLGLDSFPEKEEEDRESLSFRGVLKLVLGWAGLL